MVSSIISNYDFAIKFPVNLIGKKFYIIDNANVCVNAIKIKSIKVGMLTFGLDNGFTGIHGGASANNVYIVYDKATESGIVSNKVHISKLNLYNTPQDACEGRNVVKYSPDTLFADAFRFAMNKTELVVAYTIRMNKYLINYGTYVWDGLKPVFSRFDLRNHMTLLCDDVNGWHFENNDFSDCGLDFKDMNATEQECRAKHSLKVYDFPEVF